ncbi:MAG TPA: M56 family metallopeptidase [Pirellulales bacterium]|nr:M56 family metallopeptidase [Pirellulales bacterium]
MSCWAATAALLLGRFGWVQRSTARRFRGLQPIAATDFCIDLAALGRRLGLRRPVPLLSSEAVGSPLVWSLWRPKLILPPGLRERLPPGQLEWALLHELAHVRRGDLWVALVQRLVQIAYFFHPAVWLANRQIDRQREFACDDAALAAASSSGRDCASALVSIAEWACGATPRSALGLFDSNSKTLLRRRVMRLANESSGAPRRLSVVSAIALVITALLVLPRVRAENEPANGTGAGASTADRPAANDATTQKSNGALQTVSGIVVDESGGPVLDAELWLKVTPRFVAYGRTDGGGRFEIEFPVAWLSPNIVGSSWTLWAYSPGHTIATQNVFDAVRGKSSKEIKLMLPPPSATRFEVVGPSGQLLPGALVQPGNIETRGYELVPEEMLPRLSSRTDQNGAAALPAIPAQRLFCVRVTSDRLGKQAINVDGKVAQAVRRLRLRETGRIEGRLVSAQPEYAREVPLWFITEGGDAQDGEWYKPQGEAVIVTDREGKFVVPAIAAGDMTDVRVAIDPSWPVRPRLGDQLRVLANQTLPLEIPLVPAVSVHGLVRVKNVGTPVAGAAVFLGYGTYGQHEIVVTDENGHFEGHVLPGSLRAHTVVLPESYAQLGELSANVFEVPAHAEQFELPAIEVVATHKVTGRLVGARDEALAAARIGLRNKNSAGHSYYVMTTTDGAGQFTMHVPDDVELGIEIWTSQGQQPVKLVSREPLIIRFAGAYELQQDPEAATATRAANESPPDDNKKSDARAKQNETGALAVQEQVAQADQKDDTPSSHIELPPLEERERALKVITGAGGSAAPDFQKLLAAGVKRKDFLKHPFVSADLRRATLTDRVIAALEAFPELERLELGKSAITDDQFAKLPLRNLRHLDLSGTAVSDQGVSHLRRLEKLEWLDLSGTAVTDKGLAALTNLKNLEIVSFDGTPITDAGVAYLAKLPRLGALGLSGTAIGDAGLEHLRNSTSLSSLRLKGTRVTDAGIVALKALSKLRNLELQDTPVSDAGIEAISHLPDIQYLYLGGTRITDTSAESIAQWKNLKRLDLTGTLVSDVGLKHLQELRQLVWFLLEVTQITDVGLQSLANMAKLESLNLADTPITDAGLAYLKPLVSLRELNLSGTQISDPRLEAIKDLPRMGSVDVRRTKVTALDVFRALPQTNPNVQKILAALGEKTELDFSRQPLADVIDYLKQRHDIEIQVGYKSVLDAGVGLDTPITATFKGALREALEKVLDPLKLTFAIRHEVLLISAKPPGEKFPDFPVVPAGERISPKLAEAFVQKTELDFAEQPFRNVIAFLSKKHGIVIDIDAKSLVAAGIGLDVPMSRWVKGITLKSALELLLADLDLTCVAEGEKVLIRAKSDE